jgi:YVTN family beta-propeller protein
MNASQRLLPIVCLLAVPFTAHAGRAYVSNEDGQSVTVIDTDKAAVVATVPIGKRPRGLKLSEDGTQLYVAVSGLPKCPPTTPDEECEKLERDLKADGLAVMDTRTHKVLRVLHAGSDPEQFAIHPDGRIFVANEDIATTSVVDPKSGKVVAHVKVGEEPEGVGVSPDGKWVLVTNESDNSISVIDVKTLKEVHHIIVGKRPRDVAFTPDSKFAYVSGEFDASLYRVALPDGKPTERIIQMRKEAKPMSVQLDWKRNRIYMSTGRGGTVAVIDLLPKPKLVTEIQVGARPWGIALSKDGSRLYTANGPSNDVSIVDTATLKVIKKLPAGKSPWGVTLAE